MALAMLASAQDALLPRPHGGLGRGALLAFIAHAALIAALALGLRWHASAPEVVSAELWAALPQVAAPRIEETVAVPPVTTPAPTPAPTPAAVAKPRPVETAPPPPDPQIAIEQERKVRAAKQAELQRTELARLEKERLDNAQRDKEQRERRELAERKQAEDKLAKQREENLRRMMGQAGATGTPSATGSALQDAAPSRSYAGKLVAHIKPNIVFTDSVTSTAAAEVEVRAAPSGTIVARRLVKSSGSKEWDEAVLRAIDRTGSLPRDTDGRVPPTIIVAFRPQE